MGENVANLPSPSEDDEEDLEALRLAALQTLKKNGGSSQISLIEQKDSKVGPRSVPEFAFRGGNNRHGCFSDKRGRFYGGRGMRNGQFYSGRAVSSNLISLTPSVSREDLKPNHTAKSNESVLVLPQDRYINNTSQESKSGEKYSKFDRYKDSDESEEEDSEDEALKSDSDDDSPLKLERSDSLEALMQELDDEIQGKSTGKEKEEKPAKVKTRTKRKKEICKVDSTAENDIKTETLEVVKDELKEQDSDEKKGDESSSPKKIDSPEKNKLAFPRDQPDPIEKRERSPDREPQLKKRRHSPQIQRGFRGYRGKPLNFKRSPPLHHPQFLPGTGPFAFPPNNSIPIFNNPPFGRPNCMLTPSPFYERPLSPLLINAETLQTQTMAPLSPRSAAFVLENRAIIEKRKRSPRRSYSRSPSPRRRSLSPRRSLTPPRRRSMSPLKRSLSPMKRSLSPRKRSLSPLMKRSLSPPMMRSRSPKRRSMSPKRRSPSPKKRAYSPKQRPLSPKRRSPSPRRRSLSPRRRDRKEPIENPSKVKPSVRDRLGFKSSSKPEEKDNKGKVQSDLGSQIENKPLNPILEARKKKFEAKEIKVREGVIRLKPKDELRPEKIETETSEAGVSTGTEGESIAESEKTEKSKQEVVKEDVLNEDALLQDDELDLVAQVDLFSDEESGSENEGRFKAKQMSGEKPPAVSFSKLANGTRKETKSVRLHENKERKVRTRSRSPIQRDREVVERKPVEHKPSTELSSKTRRPRSDSISMRKKLGVKSERHPKKFERRIEIKIKNPAKYERPDKSESEKEPKTEKEKVRKVELGAVATRGRDQEDDDTEIVVENDEDEVENNVNDEGDLRAQLSKKRAEKRQKITSHKGVSSRLLQNALQNALPIKKSKKSKSKELSSSDGKLPIHLRLGLACGSDVFSKPKRKSKKRKTIESEDQPQEFGLRRDTFYCYADFS